MRSCRSNKRRQRLAEVRVRVTPKASKNRIEIGNPIKVYVSAPPIDGEANKAVIELLSKFLGVPKTRLSVVKGSAGRDKTIHIQGVSETELEAMLARSN